MADAPRNPFICSFKKVSRARVPVCGIHDYTSSLHGSTDKVENATCEACWVNDSLDQHPCQNLMPRTLIAERDGVCALMDVKWVCQAYKMELEGLEKCGSSCPKWRAVGDGEPEGEEKDFDALLGTFNRGYFNQRLAKEFSFAKSTPGELSLVMSDIDNFKRVNDTYGHLAGDDVLKFVARSAKQVVGQKGVVCRYGGEEIALLLPNYRVSEAVPLAERFREAVGRYPFRVRDKQGAEQELTVTGSLGVASLRQAMSQDSDLVRAADACLYEAKQKGKDRVIHC